MNFWSSSWHQALSATSNQYPKGQLISIALCSLIESSYSVKFQNPGCAIWSNKGHRSVYSATDIVLHSLSESPEKSLPFYALLCPICHLILNLFSGTYFRMSKATIHSIKRNVLEMLSFAFEQGTEGRFQCPPSSPVIDEGGGFALGGLE
jgi:hypothetical protein